MKNRKQNRFFPALFFAVILTFQTVPVTVLASAGLELSVTPTLFEMSAVPNQVWNSSVKVINSNKHNLTVYAEVVNFAPKGEAGEGKFLPVFENFTEGKTLAEWINISSEAVVIPPESSKSIPFTVRVPDDASPGGHFAAIMVGTRPPADRPEMQVSTSQIVTSLFFVRVAGDVIEDGVIREFTTDKKFVQTPEASFSLRFENKGNVHIQPQGQIEIFNMWGKERGVIPINHKTHFGNVLPESIRKFEFTWRGEQSVTDIGRYKAIATLGYGADQKQFQTSTTYFYVVPVKSLLIYFFSLVVGLWFITWCIKSYVRRMLALSGVDVDAYSHHDPHVTKRQLVRDGDVLIQKNKTSVKAPILSGYSDLLSRMAKGTDLSGKFRALAGFVKAYKLFFASVLVLLIILLILFSLFKDLSKEAKDFDVIIENADQQVTLSSEEIIYDAVAPQEKVANKTEFTEATTTESVDQLFALELINAADTPGLAAAMKTQLTKLGYEVGKIGSDFEDNQKRTVVVYPVGYEDEALEIGQLIGNALLSAAPESEETTTPTITVYIGNDYEFDYLD